MLKTVAFRGLLAMLAAAGVLCLAAPWGQAAAALGAPHVQPRQLTVAPEVAAVFVLPDRAEVLLLKVEEPAEYRVVYAPPAAAAPPATAAEREQAVALASGAADQGLYDGQQLGPPPTAAQREASLLGAVAWLQVATLFLVLLLLLGGYPVSRPR